MLLVDDIITTGSTAAECAAVLLAAGARFVTTLSLAMNQRVVMSLDVNTAKCPGAGCDGRLVVRINHRDHRGFWGCTNFPRCRQTLPWTAGRTRFNRLNTRDRLDDDPDVPF